MNLQRTETPGSGASEFNFRLCVFDSGKTNLRKLSFEAPAPRRHSSRTADRLAAAEGRAKLLRAPLHFPVTAFDFPGTLDVFDCGSGILTFPPDLHEADGADVARR